MWARMVCKHAWELSAVTRPARPAEHRRPEPYAMAPKTLYPLGCHWLCPRAAGHVVPTWSAQSPTGHSWPPPHTGSGPDDAWRGAASVARPLSARPGGGPRQDDPTPRALAAPQTPRGAATYTHHGGWRARRTRASSGPGGGPSPHRPSHNRPPAGRLQCARPVGSCAWGSVWEAVHRHGDRPRCPSHAAGSLGAPERGTTG